MAKRALKQERVTHQRELQQKNQERRKRQQRRETLLRLGGGALVLVVIAAAFVYYSTRGSSATGAGASAALGPITSARPTTAAGSFHQVSAPLLNGRKPVFLFIGAQYCDFCATERWAIVKALGRFGTWSHLSQGHNNTSLSAGYGSIPTFNLVNATYSSPYVTFDSRDTADDNGNPLQSLDSTEQSIFNRYDPKGSIPFVYVDGYAMLGSGYSPSELVGNSFSTVQRQLQGSGHASFVADANAEANLLTAFVCQADGNRPHTVCTNTTIASIEHGLASAHR